MSFSRICLLLHVTRRRLPASLILVGLSLKKILSLLRCVLAPTVRRLEVVVGSESLKGVVIENLDLRGARFSFTLGYRTLSYVFCSLVECCHVSIHLI